MNIVRTKASLLNLIMEIKNNNKSIGFVPTMGALHQGHISLIKCSSSQNDYTVASLFVNPTQFNNSSDLQKYPRTEESDLKKLKDSGCNIVFIPNVEEMYPEEDTRVFDFEGIDTVMEGKYRSGHFNGVAQIVSKLFDAVKPDNAYFGKKDFQQLAIISFMVKKYMPESGISIVACNIFREEDGLAMSSRNMLLTKEHRNSASIIYRTIKKYSENADNLKPSEIINSITTDINETGIFEVEYFDIVNNTSLMSVDTIKKGDTTGCIAVFAGDVRLIDNISF